MASDNALIWNGIKQFLEAYPDAPADIRYGGNSFKPKDDLYWIVDYVPAAPTRLYYGTRDIKWQSGRVVVGVMVPIEWTDLQTQEAAGALADYCRADTYMGSVRVADDPQVINGYRDGDHFRVPVSIPYEGYAPTRFDGLDIYWGVWGSNDASGKVIKSLPNKKGYDDFPLYVQANLNTNNDYVYFAFPKGMIDVSGYELFNFPEDAVEYEETIKANDGRNYVYTVLVSPYETSGVVPLDVEYSIVNGAVPIEAKGTYWGVSLNEELTAAEIKSLASSFDGNVIFYDDTVNLYGGYFHYAYPSIYGDYFTYQVLNYDEVPYIYQVKVDGIDYTVLRTPEAITETANILIEDYSRPKTGAIRDNVIYWGMSIDETPTTGTVNQLVNSRVYDNGQTSIVDEVDGRDGYFYVAYREGIVDISEYKMFGFDEVPETTTAIVTDSIGKEHEFTFLRSPFYITEPVDIEVTYSANDISGEGVTYFGLLDTETPSEAEIRSLNVVSVAVNASVTADDEYIYYAKAARNGRVNVYRLDNFDEEPVISRLFIDGVEYELSRSSYKLTGDIDVEIV